MVETSDTVMQYSVSITLLWAENMDCFGISHTRKFSKVFKSKNRGCNHSDVALIKSPIAKPRKDFLIVAR